MLILLGGDKLMIKFFRYLVFKVIIPSILWICIVSIPSSFVGVWSISTCLKQYIGSEIIPVSLKITVVVCFLISLLSFISSITYFVIRRKEKLNFPSIVTDYCIKTSEFELFFKNRENIIQRQTISFKILSQHFKEFIHCMNWSGESYTSSAISEASHRKGYSLTDSNRKTPPFSITVSLPEEKDRGFSDEYSFESQLLDNAHEMEPHLSRFVKCKTGCITLRVTAPEGLLKNCCCYIAADSNSEIMLSPKEPVLPKKIGELQYFEWKIIDVELMHYYFLAWEFC